MKYLFLLLSAFGLYAQNPSYKSFNTNDFDVQGTGIGQIRVNTNRFVPGGGGGGSIPTNISNGNFIIKTNGTFAGQLTGPDLYLSPDGFANQSIELSTSGGNPLFQMQHVTGTPGLTTGVKFQAEEADFYTDLLNDYGVFLNRGGQPRVQVVSPDGTSTLDSTNLSIGTVSGPDGNKRIDMPSNTLNFYFPNGIQQVNMQQLNDGSHYYGYHDFQLPSGDGNHHYMAYDEFYDADLDAFYGSWTAHFHNGNVAYSAYQAANGNATAAINYNGGEQAFIASTTGANKFFRLSIGGSGFLQASYDGVDRQIDYMGGNFYGNGNGVSNLSTSQVTWIMPFNNDVSGDFSAFAGFNNSGEFGFATPDSIEISSFGGTLTSVQLPNRSTVSNPTNSFTGGPVYTNSATANGILVGTVVLTTAAAGAAQLDVVYTNGGVGYVLSESQPAGTALTVRRSFSVPLAKGATFQLKTTAGTGASVTVTNVVNWN